MAKANGKPAATTNSDRRALFTQFARIVANEMSRSRLATIMSGDTTRNIDAECKYTTDPTPEDFWNWFRSDPFANKVVRLMPVHCWQVNPLVYEDLDGETATAFEEAWDALDSNLRTEKSYRKQEEGSMVYSYLHRLDVLSRVGKYGVMVLGLDDLKAGGGGEAMKVPAKFAPGPSAKRKLLYLRVFPQHLARVTQWDQDEGSPRFGQPTMYLVTFNDVSQTDSSASGSPATTTKEVHWTRVIHLAEGLQTGEVWGTEAQRCVSRNVQNLQKIMGASPEGYWQSAFNILAVETDPALGGEIDTTESDMKDSMEAMLEGLKRWGLFKGTKLNAVGPSVVDPTPFIERQVEAICVQLHCPKRIFLGSERGELASSQDDDAWNDMVKQRQVDHCTPRIVSAFVDRLINLNVLPTPGDDGYTIEWPDIASHSAQDKATVGKTVMDALAAFVNSGLDQYITFADVLTNLFDMTDEQVKSISENATAYREEEDGTSSPLLSLVGGVTAIIDLYKAAREGAVTEEQLKQVFMTVFRMSEEQADNMIADGIEVKEEPTTLPHGAKIEPSDGNVKGPIIKLPKPPPPKALPAGGAKKKPPFPK